MLGLELDLESQIGIEIWLDFGIRGSSTVTKAILLPHHPIAAAVDHTIDVPHVWKPLWIEADRLDLHGSLSLAKVEMASDVVDDLRKPSTVRQVLGPGRLHEQRQGFLDICLGGRCWNASKINIPGLLLNDRLHRGLRHGGVAILGQ